ncbi:MAG: asparagine synthase (glutamine-hydrolyzing) [Rhodospirillaceae bacterium]|jgi:asparagine synthase (glutamine-hydrolysing)|nr:asparagine synthase (glutamine-hydrolyzing) [Rhodospirillaceae bacterium]MBT5455335.1 asparagine synthase (glutamine-hydrolyzing) [Rhodospirillaceae bacterium]
MCGIAGIIARRPVRTEAIEAMLAQIAHRGPDGEGAWYEDDRTIAFGHRRLAVIDPTPAGAQPMVDPTGHYVLTFNGEIYNYLEIAERLRAEGVLLRSHCDSEVLLAAYIAWGEACLQEFNGMFAFAIYDARRKIIFCARDRFGEKPFLYHHSPGLFAFASEYKALLSLEGIRTSLEQAPLMQFLHMPRQGLDDQRQTVFSDIEQLLPGEQAVLDVETLELRISRYWDVKTDPEIAGLEEDDAIAGFRDLLSDSVRLRLRSDVPVGSCLSGGLDSGSIACLSRQHLGDEAPYHVFTGRFPGTSADEWQYAEEIVSATGTISHVTEPTADGFLDELDDFIWLNELPVGSSSQYAQWKVFQQAKEAGITVLLDGQGADELLGGYEQYFAAYLDALPADQKAAEARAIKERYPLALSPAWAEWKRRAPAALRRLLAQWTGKGSDPLFGLTADAASTLQRGKPVPPPAPFNPLNDALYEDSFRAHLPTLLRYGDRNSMAHSREVRLPFCDHRIAEFALSLPPQYLMGGAQTKRLLRQSMAGILPERIRTRWSKQGFLPPQENWFNEGLLTYLRDIVETRKFAERGHWNVSWWQACLRRFEAGEDHLAWALWRPLIAEAWQAGFVDRIDGMPKTSVH